MNRALGTMNVRDRDRARRKLANHKVLLARGGVLVQHQEPPWLRFSEQYSRLTENMHVLEKHGFDRSAAATAWDNYGKSMFQAQSNRTFRAGRPGFERTGRSGRKRLDRMLWAGPDATRSEHEKVARDFFVASGLVCGVTGHVAHIKREPAALRLTFDR